MLQNIKKSVHYSDDGEREDSDNDTRTSPRRNSSGVGERREYRDTMENIERSVVSKPKSPTLPSVNLSPARTPRTIKKIDLGAAANFGKEAQPQGNLMSSPVKQQPLPQKSKNDMLNDIFDSQSDNNGMFLFLNLRC